jgi:hypothetical protein
MEKLLLILQKDGGEVFQVCYYPSERYPILDQEAQCIKDGFKVLLSQFLPKKPGNEKR